MVLGRDISAISIAKIVDGTEDIAEVDLSSVRFVPTGNIRKVDLPNVVDVVAEPFDDIALGNLDMINVEQDQHPRTPHPADQFDCVIAAIQEVARMINGRIQELHDDGLSL